MKKKDYETLAMEEIVVEMEDGFLAASKEGKIRKESTIEVEEYVEINNEVSFD